MILNSFWAWWLVLFVWGVITGSIAAKFDAEYVVLVVSAILVVLLFVAGLTFTVDFLRWAQAWPFTPR